MTRRVRMLALVAVLEAVLSPGCLHTQTSGGSLPSDPPPERHVSLPRPRTGDSAVRPLPADCCIRDAGGDPTIKQVGCPVPVPLPEVPALVSPTGHDGPSSDSKPAEHPATATAESAESEETLPALELHPHPDPPLLAALRCFLENRAPEAVEQLKGFDKENQEALLCLLPLAVRLTEGSLDRARPQEIDNLLDQVQGLAAPLRKRAPLHIDTLAFCRLIKGFAVYEPVTENPAAFQAGSDGRPGELVQVYAQIRNFGAVRQGEQYVTRLASWGEIYDYDGKKVGQLDFGDRPDLSREPRQDYFITYRFSIPANLPPRHYTLWIYVKDVLAQPPRLAKRSLDFCVVSSGSAHGPRGGPVRDR